MKLAQVETSPNILCIGESGRGKTEMVASFCKIAPTVVLTADRRGLDTLRKHKDLDPEIELAENWDDPWQLYDRLSAHTKTFRILCLDDLGALQDVISRKIQGQARGRDEERMRSDARERLIRTQLMTGGRRLAQAQWGELDVAMNNFLSEVMALPYRIIVVTVLEDVRQHPRTGETQVYPLLMGGIRDDLMARFSLVVNLFTEEDENKDLLFCMSCRPHPRLPNKTRYGEPRTWINPSALKLIAHINRKEDTTDVETPLEQRVGNGGLKHGR